MTAEPRCWGGGGGVSHPSQLTTGLVIKSVTTSPTLAGERMLFILQVSILSEQIIVIKKQSSLKATEPDAAAKGLQRRATSKNGIFDGRKKKKRLLRQTGQRSDLGTPGIAAGEQEARNPPRKS